MRTPKRRNAMAAALSHPRYRRQIIDMKRRQRKAREKSHREAITEANQRS